jgi:hypothetical protein
MGGIVKIRFVLAVLCAVLLTGCGVIPFAAPAQKETTVVNGNSQFTPAGIKEIKHTLTAEFDFTSLPLEMSALGFEEGSDGVLMAVDRGKLITVSITTPGGVVEMKTDTIRVRPEIDGTVSHLDFFINYPDAQDANPEIRRAADQLGFVEMKTWKPIRPDFKDGTGKALANPGYGNKTGTVFSLEVHSNHDTGRMTFIYSAQLQAELYTPEATESIASTGDRPGR